MSQEGLKMSDYQQTTVTGDSWVRARSVTINNPVIGTKMIAFQEEKALVAGEGDVLTRQLGGISETLTAENINTEFPVLNPETGEQVGTATYAQVYAMLHSTYIFLAKRRDDAMATPPVVEPTNPAPVPEAPSNPTQTPTP